MAGAWIVQGMIAGLAVLLVGGACGLPIRGWWGAVSLVAGVAIALIVRHRGQTTNSEE